MKLYLLFPVIYFLLPNFAFSQRSKFCIKDEECKIQFSFCNNGLCACNLGKVFNSNGSLCLDMAPGIGTECIDDTQCFTLINRNAICNNGLCTCASGYVYLNETCIKYRKMSEQCSSEIECFDGVDLFALKCDNGQCVCNDGYYLRGEYDCRQSAKMDGQCFFDSDCENAEKYCKFKWGPTGECSDAPNISCKTTEECKNTIKHSVCAPFRGNKCTCNDTFKYDKENNLCVPEISQNNTELNFVNSIGVNEGLFTECTTDENCENVRNSFCAKFRNKCTCKDHFIFDKKSGHCVKALGSPCSESQIQDEPKCGIKHSFCNKKNICQCNKYFIYAKDGGKCYKPTREFKAHSCGSDENCYSFGPFAICSNGLCMCNLDSKYDETYKYCKFVQSSNDTNKCEDNCKNKPHSTCVSGNCICNEHYLDEDEKCTPDLGYECNLTGDDCTVKDADCIDGLCQCKNGTFQSEIRKCLTVISINDTCEFDEQCSHILQEGVCVNKTCTCSTNFTLQNNKCIKIKTFGDSCTSLKDCRTILESDNVRCRNRKCVCAYEFRLSEDKLRCVADNAAESSVQQQFILMIILLITTLLFFF